MSSLPRGEDASPWWVPGVAPELVAAGAVGQGWGRMLEPPRGWRGFGQGHGHGGNGDRRCEVWLQPSVGEGTRVAHGLEDRHLPKHFAA